MIDFWDTGIIHTFVCSSLVASAFKVEKEDVLIIWHICRLIFHMRPSQGHYLRSFQRYIGTLERLALFIQQINHCFSNMSYIPVFQSTTSEKRWVKQINKSVSKQVVIDIAPPPISIFRIPKEIVDTKPEAYIPERIGLGPYHHFRTGMQKMLRHKLAAIKKILTPVQINNFQSLVIDRLEDLEPNIRACYDEYLDLDGDTLAWILAIDGLFLLYRVGYGLTQNPKFHHPEGITQGDDGHKDVIANPDGSVEIGMLNEEIEALESDISWKDIARIPQELVIHPRETLMLENQIPLFVLTELLKALNLSASDDSLDGMLAAYGSIHSPLQMMPRVKFHHEAAPAHLLDYMYHLVVSNIKPKIKEKWDDVKPKEEPSNSKFEGVKKFFDNMKEVVTLALPDEELPKPVLLFKKLICLTPFDSLSAISDTDGKTIAEISIPCVKDLYEAAGIKIGATEGGIRDVRYDDKEFIFYLPKINLESNSEVILRNMIAYEQLTGIPGSIFELTEYIDMMCGIIDTVKDVEMLRESGVITGDLSNDEIVKIFNGIPKCENKPEEASSIRIAFIGMKKRFDGMPIVRAWKALKKQMVIWWKVLVITSTVLVVFFLIYKQVCDVYECSLFGLSTLQQPLIKRLHGPI